MGTALTGNTISSSYLGLIKTTDSAAISSSAKRLTDGAGNDSPLYLSTTRLGIGITPTDTLHVSGDFNLTGAFKDSSGDTGSAGQILSSTGSGTNWIANDVGDITSVVAGDGLTGGGTSGDVTLNVGAGNLIDVQADQIDVDLSELTTSTSDADGDFFAVVDDANAQKKLTKGNINLSGFNNDLSIPTVSGTTNKIAKFTASTTVGDSVITEVSSEIGINIASPQEMLHQHIGSSSTNYHQFTNSTTGSAVNNGLLVGINSAGEAQILNKLNSANAKIRLATYAGTTIMDLNGNIEADNGSNGDQYLRISNNDSGTAAQSTIYVSNSGANADGLFAGALGTSFTTASGFVQDGVAIGSGTGASGGLSIMTRAAADMRFYTNGHTNERMRITSAGNVLVGATNSDIGGSVTGVKFTQDGMILASDDATGDTSSVLYLDRRGTNNEGKVLMFGMGGFLKAGIGVIGTSANTNDGGITFETIGTNPATYDERMRITQAGNVGIGTTSPNPFSWGNKHLTVEAPGTNQYAALDLVGSGNGAGAIIFGGGSGSGTATNIGRALITALDGSHLAFYTNASNSGASFTERLRITSGGNVGIGTASPHNDVSGLSIAVAGSTDQLYLERTGSGTGRYYLGTSSNEFFIVDDVAASTRLKIDSSGNLETGDITIAHDDTPTLNFKKLSSADVLGIINVSTDAGSGGKMEFKTKRNGNTALVALTIDDDQLATFENQLTVDYNVDGTFAAPQFRINGGASGYSSSHYLDADSYHIQTNSSARDIEVIANTNGVVLSAGGTSWSAISDITLKENIKPLENVLDKIKDYQCVEYNFKNDDDKKKRIGLIAQDWEGDFSPVVNEKNGKLTMSYTETIPVLLKAIQELEDRVKELENK